MWMSARSARNRLALVWFLGVLPLFLFVIPGVVAAPDTGASTWPWFLPTVMPNLSLIVGVWVADTRAGQAEDRQVDVFTYRLTLGLSAFYLLAIGALFLTHPFHPQGLAAWLQASQPWLAALQGLASLAMGAFYVQRSG
jgi:hypothetical protein